MLKLTTIKTQGHFLHQETQLAYNGVRPNVERLVQGFGAVDKTQSLPTLNRES